jgi:ribonuclease T2
MKPATSVVAMVLVCASLAGAIRSSQGKSNQAVQFDYYVLALSWAPNYCGEHPGDNSKECQAEAHANFVLHGLWPQVTGGSSPVRCAAARPVSSAIVHHMLQYFPSRGLIQHEWQEHGVCSGLSAADYFKKVEDAFNGIKIPEEYQRLTPGRSITVPDVERSFARANNGPPEAFRVSCHSGQLVSVQACLSKDLELQACTASVRECPDTQILMRAVK